LRGFPIKGGRWQSNRFHHSPGLCGVSFRTLRAVGRLR
jgi:hypothetical protein